MCSVELAQQLSKMTCVSGGSFGCHDSNTMWTMHGCQGHFHCGKSSLAVKCGHYLNNPLQRINCSCRSAGARARRASGWDRPSVRIVQRCLEDGTWKATQTQQLNLTAAIVDTNSPHACNKRRGGRNGLDVERARWRGRLSECDRLLHHPILGHFGGVFSRPSAPVWIAVLGDSVGSQLRVALQNAKAANPVHLAALKVRSQTASASSHPDISSWDEVGWWCQSVLHYL